MIVILYVAALIAALAFALIAIYLAKTLKSLSRTFDSVADTLDGFEQQMQGITHETTELLHKTNELAEDIQGKTAKLDVLFDGVKGIGETVKDFNESLQTLSSEITRTAEQEDDKVAKTVKWGAAIIDIFQRRKQ